MFRLGSLIVILSLMGSILAATVSMDANSTGENELYDEMMMPCEIQVEPNFIENTGFIHEKIRYVARTGFGFAAFTDEGVILDSMELDGSDQDLDFSIVKVLFNDGIPVSPSGEGETNTNVNFITKGHITETKAFSSIVYEDVWEGVDIVYYFADDQLKYDLRLEDPSSIEMIQFNVEGAEQLHIDGRNLNIVVNEDHVISDSGLRGYYSDGTMDPVSLDFRIIDEFSYGFIGHGIDEGRPLVIDPIITSTFVGGGFPESPGGMTEDDEGYIYLAGQTMSFDFPTTTGAYSTRINGNMDGYVMKMDADMSGIQFSTYIGGEMDDDLRGVEVGNDGFIYVTGFTLSRDFPTTRGAYNETNNNGTWDLVAFKLDPLGNKLAYSTYIGGEDRDVVSAYDSIEVDSSGCVYIIGSSDSPDFPCSEDAYDDYNPSGGWMPTTKATLTKLSSDGSSIEYSTFLGGGGRDSSSGFDIDEEGYVYIIGSTDSWDFPITDNAFMANMDGWSSVFVTKMDITSSTLVYSTYFGSDMMTNANDIIVDSEGKAIITGTISGNNIPTTEGVYDDTLNGWSDAFVAKFNTLGTDLDYMTLIGGSETEEARSLDLLSDGKVVVTGQTWSTDYPTTVDCDVHVTMENPDVILSVIESDASDLYFSTLIGNSGRDEGYIVRTIENDDVLVKGYTNSKDFPTTDGAFDPDYNDQSDVFVLRFNLSIPPMGIRDLELSRGDHYIRFDWNEPIYNGGMDISHYRVYRTEMVMEGETEIFNTTETFYNDTNVEPGSRYSYFIRPVNLVGEGVPSEAVKVKAIEVTSSPSHLQAEWTGEKVVLSWIRPFHDGYSIIRGYVLYKNTLETEKVEMIHLDDIASSYDDRDVEYGITYSYWISCVNDAGESNASDTISILPIGVSTSPIEPQYQRYSGGVEINWTYPEFDGGSDIKEYIVEREDENGNVWIRNVTGTYFNDSDVEIGHTYTYRIRALNDAGSSPWTDPLLILIMSRPTCPVEVSTFSKQESVMITWKEPDQIGYCDLSGYRIYRIDGDSAELLEDVDFDVSVLTIDDLTNGEDYSFAISAYNPLGESDLTEPIICRPCASPSSPLDLIATIGDGKVNLDWENPESDGGSSITGFLIQRSVNGGEPIPLFETVSGELTFEDTDVVNGVSYEYTVRAKNSAGTSNPSNEVTAVPGGIPSKPEPWIVSSSGGSIELAWIAPAENGGRPIDSYLVYRSDSNSGPFDPIHETPETWIVDEDVEIGREYHYRITAVTTIGESPMSVLITAISTGTPDKPLLKTVTEDGEGVVTIVWEEPSFDGGLSILNYRIFRWAAEEEPVEIGMVGPEISSYSDHSAEKGTTYQYAVAAVNLEGSGNMSSSMEFTTAEEKEEKESGNLVLTIIMGAMIMILLVAIVFLLARRKRPSGEMAQQEAVQDYTDLPMAAPDEQLVPPVENEMLPETDPQEDLYELPVPKTL